MGLQQLDRVAVAVIEDQQAFDLDRIEPLLDTIEVDRLQRRTQLLDEDEWRSRRPAFITPAAGETVDNGEAETVLLWGAPSDAEILRKYSRRIRSLRRECFSSTTPSAHSYAFSTMRTLRDVYGYAAEWCGISSQDRPR